MLRNHAVRGMYIPFSGAFFPGGLSVTVKLATNLVNILCKSSFNRCLPKNMPAGGYAQDRPTDRQNGGARDAALPGSRPGQLQPDPIGAAAGVVRQQTRHLGGDVRGGKAVAPEVALLGQPRQGPQPPVGAEGNRPPGVRSLPAGPRQITDILQPIDRFGPRRLSNIRRRSIPSQMMWRNTPAASLLDRLGKGFCLTFGMIEKRHFAWARPPCYPLRRYRRRSHPPGLGQTSVLPSQSPGQNFVGDVAPGKYGISIRVSHPQVGQIEKTPNC